MKTADDITKELCDTTKRWDLYGSLRIAVIGTQRDSYRAGMEAAARMCGEAGDKIGLKHGVANYKTYEADGCYRCQTILEDAAKTAQLP